MVTAYVIVKVYPGEENKVSQEILKIKGILEAAFTWGYSDMLLKVKTDSLEELREMIFNKLRKIPGINDTQTVIVSEYFL